MPKTSLQALLISYRSQAEWLTSQAEEFETGARKMTGKIRGNEIDMSPDIAVEYRHKARNLLTVIQAAERLYAKDEKHSEYWCG